MLRAKLPKLLANIYSGIITIGTRSEVIRQKYRDNNHKKGEEPRLGSAFDLINQLNEAMKVGKGKDVMGKVLTSLIDYTKYHFGTEEKLMQTHSYPSYIIHKKAHDDLTKQAMDLQKKLEAGNLVVTIEVMSFLKDWLSKHIMSPAKQYTSFFKGKGV